MCWSDKVYIAASLALKVEHQFAELLGADGLALAEVAYVVVLAEDATEVAAGEEDGTASAGADENGLFTVMRADRTYFQLIGNTAEAGLTFGAAGFALAGAECAGIGQFP